MARVSEDGLPIMCQKRIWCRVGRKLRGSTTVDWRKRMRRAFGGVQQSRTQRRRQLLREVGNYSIQDTMGSKHWPRPLKPGLEGLEGHWSAIGVPLETAGRHWHQGCCILHKKVLAQVEAQQLPRNLH